MPYGIRIAVGAESRVARYRSRAVGRKVNAALDAHLMEPIAVNHLISELVTASEPFLIARPGTLEAQWMDFVLAYRLTAIVPLLPTPKLLPPGLRSWDEETATGLDEFVTRYLAAAATADVLAHWSIDAERPFELLSSPLTVGRQIHVPAAALWPLNALEAGHQPWTAALAGKRVLVVHPFRRSIEAQWRRRAEITIVKDLMPPATVEVVPPPALPHQHETYWLRTLAWRDRLADTIKEIASRRFDVALVAAGPLGLLIADGIRLLGGSAIHLGGPVQLLFGIRGGRWDRSGSVPGMDGTWIRPFDEDIAPEIRDLEHGAYI